MKQRIKSMIELSLRSFDIEIARYGSLQKLQAKQQKLRAELKKLKEKAIDIDLLLTLPNEQASELLKNLGKSQSQLRQDLFVLSELNFKKNGYFVEFGATNGVNLSNTYLLEKEFGWTGILAEPAICWHEDLKKKRKAKIETRCVWKDSSSTLNFNEVGELSTINLYSNSDFHKEKRKKGNTYEVQTISLSELLEKHQAPADIDYLSIDTEGSEFEILNNFDFSKHSFKIITCEHNFTPMRENIFELMVKNGYVRKFENLSYFDDWYVRADVAIS